MGELMTETRFKYTIMSTLLEYPGLGSEQLEINFPAGCRSRAPKDSN